MKKYQNLGIHVIIWLLVMTFPILFMLQADDGGERSVILGNIVKLQLFMNVLWIISFYINALYLIPKLLYKRRFGLYVFGNLALFGIILLINWGMFNLIFEGRGKPYSLIKALWYNGGTFFFFVMVSIAYRALTDQIKADRLANEKKRQDLQTELSFLRSQISPHFLFNVLNNIIALVRLKSDELEPTILKLSALMQYMLYSTDDEKVLLKSEVEYLQNYVDLQKLRYGDRLTLNVDLQPEEDWLAIEPMLLVPFIENAFKHGTGMLENPIIEVSLTAKDHLLNFSVRNTYVQGDRAKDKVSGIGLANVKRRLELLYGKDQQLTIDQNEDWYNINLQIKLEP